MKYSLLFLISLTIFQKKLKVINLMPQCHINCLPVVVGDIPEVVSTGSEISSARLQNMAGDWGGCKAMDSD